MQARRKMTHQTAAIASALCVFGAVARAGAQEATHEGFALDKFQPAPAGDRMFGVQSPYAAGDLTPHLMILGDYAQDPLVLRTKDGNDDRGTIVGSQLLLHLSASMALWNRLTLS